VGASPSVVSGVTLVIGYPAAIAQQRALA